MARKGGLVVVVSAPSGCGKTTLVEALCARDKRLVRSVSATTREPRRGELDGRDYVFLAPGEFRARRRQGAFLEWARVFGHYYGTLKEEVDAKLEAGRDVILAIDVHGHRQVRRRKTRGVVSLFIMPPRASELEVRLKKRRSDTPGEIKRRLERARHEMACAGEYDYLVTNRDVNEAIREMEEIVKAERQRRRGASENQKGVKAHGLYSSGKTFERA